MPQPRVPDVVKERRGTLQPCRAHGAPIIAPDTEVPAPPEHLGAVAAQVWASRARVLVEVGLWSRHHSEVLEGYCSAYAAAREAEAAIVEHGLLIPCEKGSFKANPASAVATQRWAQLRAYAIELGFTPAHAITGGSAPEDTTAEELFGGDPIVIRGGKGD
jgi:P27 family predicted phage terminase small subunit